MRFQLPPGPSSAAGEPPRVEPFFVLLNIKHLGVLVKKDPPAPSLEPGGQPTWGGPTSSILNNHLGNSYVQAHLGQVRMGTEFRQAWISIWANPQASCVTSHGSFTSCNSQFLMWIEISTLLSVLLRELYVTRRTVPGTVPFLYIHISVLLDMAR